MPNVNNTPVEKGLLDIKASIDAGQETVNITRALSEKDDYVCAINSTRGIISVKMKEGKIKEDSLVGGTNETIFIIGDKVYKLHNAFGKWMKMDYVDDLSQKQLTTLFMSEKEMMSLGSGKSICVKADVDPGEFNVPTQEAYDVKEVLSELGFEYK